MSRKGQLELETVASERDGRHDEQERGREEEEGFEHGRKMARQERERWKLEGARRNKVDAVGGVGPVPSS